MQLINETELGRFYKEDLDENQIIFSSLIDLLISQLEQIIIFDVNLENLKKLAILSHKIKSGVRSFGAEVIFSQIEALEESAKQENLKDCAAITNNLIKDINSTVKLLLKYKDLKALKVKS